MCVGGSPLGRVSEAGAENLAQPMKKFLLALPFILAIASINISDSRSQTDKYYRDGKPLNCVDANGMRQGYWKITAGMMKFGSPWTPDQIVREGNYVDSYCTGTWIEYDSNGSKIAERIYDEDHHHLLLKQFEDARLIAETNYQYSVHYYPVVIQFNNESLKQKSAREYAIHEGIAKKYYPDGTLWTEMTWKDGRLDGPAKTYYPSGKLCEEGIWHYNYWVGNYTVYNEEGGVDRMIRFADNSTPKYY